ncbi:MAG: Crp/Fnr family transcriptional regulator [Burkholderiaceae bacterium]
MSAQSARADTAAADDAAATADAAALVTRAAPGGGPKLSASQQLAAAGLELLGPCQHLSQWPGIMAHSALLHDFTPAEADILGLAMLRLKAQPGQVLIAENEASDWMMLLLSGTVDIGKRKIGAGLDALESGEISRLAVVKSGAVIGEMSMLDGEPRYASCWALCEVEAAVLTRAGIAGLITQHPGVGAKLLVKLTQLLAQRLRNTSNQLLRQLHKSTL